MLSKAKILRQLSLRDEILMIIILCMSIWSAAPAETLAQQAAPVALDMTAYSTLPSLEGAGSSKTPYLVLGMTDRRDIPSYGLLWYAGDEATIPSAENTITRQDGLAASVSRAHKVGSDPLILLSLTDSNAGLTGLFIYGYPANYLSPEQPLANSESYMHKGVQPARPLFDLELGGWRLPVMLSGGQSHDSSPNLWWPTVPRLDARLRLILAAITLTISLPCLASGWAAASKEDICNADADFALRLADYSAAIASHRNILRTQTDNALAHYHLGFAYGMTGRKTDEINEYLAAARLGLTKWDLFLNLGVAYLSQNDGPNAIKTLQTAVLLGPKHPEAHFNLAIAYEKGNRLGEALQEITLSLRLAPGDSDGQNTKGVICAELGNLVCARDEWEHLVQAVPDYAPARANLAILNGSHMSLASISSPLGGDGFAFAHWRYGFNVAFH
jgi:Flp pilus assembly protein TadD